MSRINEKQRTEWTENPVTIKLRELVEKELKQVLETPILDGLVHGEPQKTQDNLVSLEERGLMWITLTDLLKGDWSYLEDEQDE